MRYDTHLIVVFDRFLCTFPTFGRDVAIRVLLNLGGVGVVDRD